MEDGIRIVFKNKNTVIINKPVGMPSQPDPSGDDDAMSKTSKLLASLGESSDLWLVHRLDRAVGGLIVFARNKKSAAALSETVKNGKMEKQYFAVCHGSADEGEYRDFLFKDNATSKAYIVKTERRGAKEAILNARKIDGQNGMSLMSVKLVTGRFHQIRAQFAARGNSLVGDKKYGSRDTERRTPALFSYYLSFMLFGKRIIAKARPDINEYPWNIFTEDKYSIEGDMQS